MSSIKPQKVRMFRRGKLKTEESYRPKGKAKRKQTPNKFIGAISINSRAVGYVRPSDNFPLKQDDDIEITFEFLNTALNGDQVEISLLPKKHGLRQGGRVERIIKRSKTRFSGTIAKRTQAYIVVPDDKKCYVDYFILSDKKDEKKLKEGDKVVVELLPWDNPQTNPTAKLHRVLGRAGDSEAEMNAIVLSGGFDYLFPAEAAREAKDIKSTFSISAHTESRRDMRGVATFTIDPEDAKDFDDALSVRELDGGTTEIGVHIADVSHFVHPNSALDREALERAVSVYLVGRTIPMLPPELSEDLCSLRPDEDKLAFSAIFKIDSKARVLERWFGRTVIRSGKRFTYEEAQKILDGTVYNIYSGHLSTLNKLAKIMKQERIEQGAIEFETEEVAIELDSRGFPIAVHKKLRQDTNKLVEEFMLLANREVARFIEKLDKAGQERIRPFIYRVHDLPDVQKIEDLGIFVRALGHTLPKRPKGVTPKDISALLSRFEGEAAQGVVRSAALKAMAKAVYSVTNIGHFGLSATHYTHFTSPIRRYPDIMVHRLLARYLAADNVKESELENLQQSALHCTRREIEAVEIERASVKYNQVKFLAGRVGDEFDATISGVTEWGIYVEDTVTKAEGMLRLRALKDDYYELDEKNYRLVGKRTRKTYSLGDKLRVRLITADQERRTLDFELAS
jgi:ribonuclease R